MKPSIELDMREFNKALKEYMRYTSRDVAEVLNAKAFFIAKGATVTTRKAEAGTIRTELSQGGFQRVRPVRSGKRKGKLGRRGRVVNTLAERILWKRYRASGRDLPKNKDMGKRVQRMIRGRIKAIGFIAAGWIPAIKQLYKAPRAKGKGPRQDKKVKLTNTKDMGGATAARADRKMRSYARIWNSAINQRGVTGVTALQDIGLRGLQRAFNDETASMREYITNKLAKRAKKYSRGKHR